MNIQSNHQATFKGITESNPISLRDIIQKLPEEPNEIKSHFTNAGPQEIK